MLVNKCDPRDGSPEIKVIRSWGAGKNNKKVKQGNIGLKIFLQWSMSPVPNNYFTGADVNIKDNFGRSPLHVAAAADYVEMMTFLITCGADIGAQTSGEEQTVLHYAAKNGAVNCVKVLLTQGADIDSRDFKGRTPLQVG